MIIPLICEYKNRYLKGSWIDLFYHFCPVPVVHGIWKGRKEEGKGEREGTGREGMGREERKRLELVKEEEAMNEIKTIRDTAS